MAQHLHGEAGGCGCLGPLVLCCVDASGRLYEQYGFMLRPLQLDEVGLVVHVIHLVHAQPHHPAQPRESQCFLITKHSLLNSVQIIKLLLSLLARHAAPYIMISPTNLGYLSINIVLRNFHYPA